MIVSFNWIESIGTLRIDMDEIHIENCTESDFNNFRKYSRTPQKVVNPVCGDAVGFQIWTDRPFCSRDKPRWIQSLHSNWGYQCDVASPRALNNRTRGCMTIRFSQTLGSVFHFWDRLAVRFHYVTLNSTAILWLEEIFSFGNTKLFSCDEIDTGSCDSRHPSSAVSVARNLCPHAIEDALFWRGELCGIFRKDWDGIRFSNFRLAVPLQRELSGSNRWMLIAPAVIRLRHMASSRSCPGDWANLNVMPLALL
jgi:hypothetical protein